MSLVECIHCGYQWLSEQNCYCDLCGNNSTTTPSNKCSGRLWYVYILQCCDDSYYIGFCSNIENRLRLHREGKGSKFVRSRRPFSRVWSMEITGKTAAMRLERSLKKLTHTQKRSWVDHKIKEAISCIAYHITFQ